MKKNVYQSGWVILRGGGAFSVTDLTEYGLILYEYEINKLVECNNQKFAKILVE